MRTYRIEKRFGGSGGRAFSRAGSQQRKRGFDFFGFLLSESVKVAEPDWFAGHLESMKYRDGSYGLFNKVDGAVTASDLYSTCYAVCAMKSLGIEPQKEAVSYIERLKKADGSFALGPNSDYSDMDTTHDATLALRLCERALPDGLAQYVAGLRNADGSYSTRKEDGSATLTSTRQALTILKAAGAELSGAEKERTADYVRSRIIEEGFEKIDSCYDAVLSLHMMDAAPGPDEQESLLEMVEKADIASEEKSFKALIIREFIGDDIRPHPPGTISGESRKLMNEVYYYVSARKLASRWRYETSKKPLSR